MYRLIYKSRGNGEINWDVIADIMHTSEKNNLKNNITGVLLASDTHFLQVIEGKYEDVNATFMRIVRDSRHTDIKLISFHAVDARLFDAWGMKGIGIFDFNKDIEKQLIDKYGAQDSDSSVKFPLEEWMALAMIQDIKMIRDLPAWKK